MFGLDQLFDFDKNGKLDAFERAAEMTFLYSAEEAARESDRRYGRQKGFDQYGSENCFESESCFEKEGVDWEDN